MNWPRILVCTLLAAAPALLAAQENTVPDTELTTLVSQSPNGKIEIITDEPLPLTMFEGEDTRWVGRNDAEPEYVLFVDAASRKVLGRVEGRATGPVAAAWRADSRYVILYWESYRFNWDNSLVWLNEKNEPVVIEPDYPAFRDAILKDTRPVMERHPDVESNACVDLDYPIAKMSWFFAPRCWKKLTDTLEFSCVETTRDGQSPHPFQQECALDYRLEMSLNRDRVTPVGLWHGAAKVWPERTETIAFDPSQPLALDVNLELRFVGERVEKFGAQTFVRATAEDGAVIRTLPIAKTNSKVILDFCRTQIDLQITEPEVTIARFLARACELLESPIFPNREHFPAFETHASTPGDLTLKRILWNPQLGCWYLQFLPDVLDLDPTVSVVFPSPPDTLD